MKVILLEKIHRLGNLGEIVEVKPGFARNFLLIQGKAKRATEANIKALEQQRAELEKIAAKHLAAAQKRAKELEKVGTIILVRRALEEGKLFGSIGIKDIVDALAEKNIVVEKKEINMPATAIRQTGEYEVEIVLHSDVQVPLKVNVQAEAVEEPVTTGSEE
ncbi:MAG: 50S ribosomal protein L9 [Gammaproteobacteria bacterium]|nr:50S ribosomal protein L9 [Gammaproteobacteria bacterium]